MPSAVDRAMLQLQEVWEAGAQQRALPKSWQALQATEYEPREARCALPSARPAAPAPAAALPQTRSPPRISSACSSRRGGATSTAGRADWTMA